MREPPVIPNSEPGPEIRAAAPSRYPALAASLALVASLPYVLVRRFDAAPHAVAAGAGTWVVGVALRGLGAVPLVCDFRILEQPLEQPDERRLTRLRLARLVAHEFLLVAGWP
jgi:hypothetical protein